VLAQHSAQHMIAHGGGGRIVNISTIGAHAVHKDAAVYDSAKGAVEVMTKTSPMSWRRMAAASTA
jgi:NAD(P)-dependent dehydrogenase (short-subunit alcohol dehydrogenase family)